MNSVLARVLIRLYPRAWRERYGAEFEMHLVEGPGGVRSALDVVWSAAKERMVPALGGKMEKPVYSFGGVMKNWSAFVPVAMSLTALTLVLVRVALAGTGPEVVVNGRPDEGAVAHIWQLLMGAQLPVCWRSSQCSGCAGRRGRRWVCWRCRLGRCWRRWRRCFISISD
jgi:hypothetical protein